jgi:GH24 family phage-related lysozyme (muramidase)
MAVGTGFGLDLSAIDNALKEADNKIKSLTDKTHNLSKTTISAFQQMTNQGVIPYVESLKRQAKALENLGAAAGKSGLTTLQADAKLAVDEINKVVNALQNAYRREQSGKDALSFSKSVLSGRGEVKSIENMRLAIQRLEEAQNRQNLKTQTGRNNYKKIGQEIERVQLELRRATGENDSFIKSLGKVGKAVASVFSIQAIRGYINQMIKVRGELELQQRSLQAIIQNKAEANEVWQKTIDLAVRSPFRIKDLVTYTKQLAAYRVEADKLYDTNKMLADVSAGLGVDMNRLILAFGQVKSANFLRGTELRQFTEAGIPMLDELAKLYTQMEGALVTSGDVFERISKRMVLFEDVEEVLKRMTAAGGTFYRMQEIQSETLKGQISNLKDSVDIMLNSMGKDMDGVLKKGVKSVKFLVDNYQALIPVLKAIIAALALYKINTFQASSATLMYARNLGVAKASASGLGAIWATLRVSLNKFKIALGETAAMLVSNPWILLATAIAAAAIKLHQFWKELEKVDKKYSQLLDKQGDVYLAFRQAGQKGDLEEQIAERRKQLQALVDMAKNEYGLVVDINVGAINESKLEEEFNKIRQKMIELNAFSASFTKEMIKSDKLSKWYGEDYFGLEEGLFEDIQDLGGSYDKLYQEMINKSGRTVEILRDKWDDLTDAQQKAVEDLEKPIQGNESLVDYVNRLKDAYTDLLELKDVKNNKISRLIRRFNSDVREVNTEFKLFANRFREEVNNITDEKEKVEFLDVSIGAMADEKEWNEFEENYIRRLVEQEFGITFVPKTATPEELKAWQKSYESLFKGFTGYRDLAPSTSQSQVIERLQGTYESLADTIEKIEAAGEDSVLAGGAYEGQDLNKLKSDLAEVKRQLDWFGAQAKKDNKKESASIKILQKRINLLKEVNKKYLELEKTFDAVTAKEKVMEAYSDTFREAFEGTGVDLDLYKVMTETIVDASKVGGEAGSALTEGMLEKLKELESAGTYIRSFSDDLVEEIKKAEGFRAKAYQDAGGVWTQGYGETQGIEKDKAWTEEFAAQRLQIRLTKDYAAAVNKVLDANKDLIVTQEQYNALVDLAYQGGGGAVKNLVNYAKNIEQGSSYIERISEKIKATMGEETAARFGETFVNSFKEAETIQERMALLLQTMNLTIKGKINKDWYEGMQARSDKRAAMFSGDLDVANQLETVLVRIAGMDFTTTEGMVEALGKLKEIAEKEGPEAKNILSQAISGLEAEIGVRVKKESDKKLNDEVQALFDRYELTVDLKKLNIPKDLAKSLFDVDYLDLNGLKKAVQDQEAKFIGTDMEKEYEDFLKKIKDLSRKQREDEAKEFVNFLKKNLNEIQVIQDKGAYNIALADRLFGEGKITAEQYMSSIRQIVEDTNKEVAKVNLDKFKDSATYIKAMGNLAAYSRDELEGMMNALQGQVGANAGNMGADEIRAYYEALERLVEQYDKIESPFQKGEINDLIEYLNLQKQLNQEKEKEVVLEQRKAELNTRLMLLQNKLASQQASGDTEGAKFTQGLIKGAVNELKEVDGQLVSVTSNISVISEKVANLGDGMVKSLVVAQKIVNEIANVANAATKIFDDVKNAADALGADTESGGWERAGIAMEMVGGVSSELTQGLANFASGNYAEALANVVGMVTKLVSGFAKLHDQKYQDTIEAQAEEVERLGKAYEKLEAATEKAYSIEQLQKANEELERNVELQIASYKAMIAAERAKKDTDDDQISAWNEELAALTEQWEDLQASLLEGVGGVSKDNYRSQTREFVDSWVSAFKETGNGLQGLKDNFREFFDNIIAEQAAMRVTEKFLEPFYESLNEALKDYELTAEESKGLREMVEKIAPDLSSALEKIWGQLGGSGGGDAGSLSALQKGIQGITEDTAQIIEAYMNSIRGYVSEQVTHTRNIYRILNDAVHSDAAAIRVRMV